MKIVYNNELPIMQLVNVNGKCNGLSIIFQILGREKDFDNGEIMYDDSYNDYYGDSWGDSWD